MSKQKMDTFKIEIDLGKPTDKNVFVRVPATGLYFVWRFCEVIEVYFNKYRSRVRIKTLVSINLAKTIVTIVIISIVIPIFVFLLALIFNGGDTGEVNNYFIAVPALALVLIVGYLAFRTILEAIISFICLFRSIVVATIYSIKYLIRKRG